MVTLGPFIMDQQISFIVRRARLVTGVTQHRFAEMFDVDDTTVSRWERGKLRPAAPVLKRMTEIVSQKASLLSDDAIRASHVYKFLVPMDNLKKSLVASQGAINQLGRVGLAYDELDDERIFTETSQSSEHYLESSFVALKEIERHPGWLEGQILYAEAHCFAPRIDTWIDLMVAPMPDRYAALIEAVPSIRGEAEGFNVRLTFLGR
jgi:transcriptional regulator with XRE-family HTH domain